MVIQVGVALAAIKPSGSDDNTETALAFYTSDNDTTLDERMRISSAGIVTTPNQPSFRVGTS